MQCSSHFNVNNVSLSLACNIIVQLIPSYMQKIMCVRRLFYIAAKDTPFV